MENNPYEIENLSLVFESGDSEKKIEILNYLEGKNLSDEALEKVCSLIDDKDYGVRNAITWFLTSLDNKNTARHIIKYISSENISTRNLAGEILIKLGEKSTNSLLKSLKKANDDDTKFIIDVLGFIGDIKACPEIIKILHESKNGNVLLACVEALGNIRCPNSVEHLINFYGKDELYDPTIIESLGKINDAGVLEFVLSKYDEEKYLNKFSIIECLGKIGNEETFFFLLGKLKETESPLVWPILDSIFLLKNKYNLDIPFDEKVKHVIIRTIDEADKNYKVIATRLITTFDDKDSILASLSAYGLDAELDEILREKFIDKISYLYVKLTELINAGNWNIKYLLQLLKDSLEINKDIHQHTSAVEFRNLIDAVSRCLNNPDEEVRSLAVEILFEVDPDTALLFIDNIAEDDNLWIKLKMMDYLELLNTDEVNEVLKKLSNDPEEMISDRAKEILASRTLPN